MRHDFSSISLSTEGFIREYVPTHTNTDYVCGFRTTICSAAVVVLVERVTCYPVAHGLHRSLYVSDARAYTQQFTFSADERARARDPFRTGSSDEFLREITHTNQNRKEPVHTITVAVRQSSSSTRCDVATIPSHSVRMAGPKHAKIIIIIWQYVRRMQDASGDSRVQVSRAAAAHICRLGNYNTPALVRAHAQRGCTAMLQVPVCFA